MASRTKTLHNSSQMLIDCPFISGAKERQILLPANKISQERNAMFNKQTGGVSEDFGKLILRATLALLILFHGVSKVINGPGAVLGAVTKFGLPPAVGYLV